MATLAPPLEADERRSQTVPAEVQLLRRLSHGVLGVLVLVAAGCATGLVVMLPEGTPTSARLISIALLGGALGGAASAMRSICDRLGRGFELEHGLNWPAGARRGEKIAMGTLPYLLVRPVLGAATGVVAYAGVAGGFLIATSGDTASVSAEGVLFFALLSGLFAKTFLQRLDIVFKTMLGEDIDAERPAARRRGGTEAEGAQETLQH